MTAPVGRDRPIPSAARTVAQAKVNLFLRVLAREANGYHQLETLFCRLEVGDTVVVRTRVNGRSLDCAGDVIPPQGLGPVEQNLAWRAADAYAAATGWPNAWAIEITKRIPVGGGLGGGSSDGGAVLRCLNALNPRPLPPGDLVTLATPLGADVPFLASEAPLALAWGRGERLLALPALPARDVALMCFSFGVSTRDAYTWLDEASHANQPRGVMIDVESLRSWDGVAALAHNDFESVVAPRFAAIASALRALRSSAAAERDASAITLLAGSGATVFMITQASRSDMFPVQSEPAHYVHTRTATRVVAVDASD